MKELGFASILALALLSVGCARSNDPRYFDYSGGDGCSPANLGHRLGGDLDQFPDNTIAGLLGIVDEQGDECFKNWEFDLNESVGGLVVFHDSTINGVPVIDLSVDELPPGVVKPAELIRQFSLIKATKPIIIDLKTLRSEAAVREAIDIARQINAVQDVEIWFIASRESARIMPNVCRIMKPEFDLLLYNRGGEYCE